MAEAATLLLKDSGKFKRSGRSYTREEKKIGVLKWYNENDCNLYKTCKKFTLNTKTVQRWMKDEEKIKNSKIGTKRVTFNRSAQFPLMEEQLHSEFRQLRRRGIQLKGWWFKNRAQQIVKELYLSEMFLSSDVGLQVLKNVIK